MDVLPVEDGPVDILMTREAFQLSRTSSTLHVAGDGQLAMQFLRRTDEYHSAPGPSLILLDINLPRRSGLEVLAELKGSDHPLTILAVILTTSHADDDIPASYQLHANAYITEPADFDLFTHARSARSPPSSSASRSNRAEPGTLAPTVTSGLFNRTR